MSDGDMSGADVEGLLPSPAAVCCNLTLDVLLQIHALLDLAEMSTDERALMDVVRRSRDRDLLVRLAESVPPEKLGAATTDGRVDLVRLEQQLPYIRIMHIMSTASTIDDEVVRRIDDASRP
jgi:hypothetical protein